MAEKEREIMNMRSVTVLKIAVIFCAILLVGIAAGAPWIAAWYARYRNMAPEVGTAITYTFYLCFVPAFIALQCLFLLLRNIGRKKPFDPRNITYLKGISWCCLAAGIFCLGGGWVYKPIFFVSGSMLFLSLLVSVPCVCFTAATKLQEENDLTV